MIQFTKNGQGFWDFDFEVLAELTTYRFAKEVEYALNHQFDLREVFDITFHATDDFVYIEIYRKTSLVTYIFDCMDKDFKRAFFFYSEMQNILNHAKKLGVIND